jgi:hypothetical protein
MVVSTLVIGSGYSVFHLLNDSYLKAKETSGKALVQMQLQSLLDHEFSTAICIRNDSGVISILQPGGELIKYSLKERCIIRDSGDATDSFPVPQSRYNIRYVFDRKPYVQELEIELDNNKEEVPYIHAISGYGSETLFYLSDSLLPNHTAYGF